MELNDAVSVLKSSDHRMTQPRQRLLELLLEADEPLTAEELHARARSSGIKASVSTVYRNLAVFVQAHLVDELPGAEGQRRFAVHRPNESSARLVCLDCGQAVPIQEIALQSLGEAIQREGFDPASLRVTLTAHCHLTCPHRS